MRFKSIGTVAAMAAMLMTLPGCSVDVDKKVTKNIQVEVALDAWDGSCTSSEDVVRSVTAEGCRHEVQATVILVPSVKKDIDDALAKEDLSPDDADVTINSVNLTATASRFEGAPFPTVGPWTLDIDIGTTSLATLTGQQFGLNQPVSFQLAKAQLGQVEKNVKTGMPLTGLVTAAWISDAPSEGGTIVADLRVDVDATASVSFWAKVF